MIPKMHLNMSFEKSRSRYCATQEVISRLWRIEIVQHRIIWIEGRGSTLIHLDQDLSP